MYWYSACCALVRPFSPQVLVGSEVLLLLAPRLLGRLGLRMWDIPGPGVRAQPGEGAEQAQQRQQLAADLVGRLGAQLAQCSGLQELSIRGLPSQLSLELATELLVLAPPQLQRLTVNTSQELETPRPAAVAALSAALALRHGSGPDAATARALHVATDLVSKQGAEEVMRAVGRAGVQGVHVECSSRQ